jgi:hypothetical protein
MQLQQPSYMKPKLRLNFSYTANSQPQHHYPSPETKNNQPNLYLPLHLLQNNKHSPPTEHHQSAKNQQPAYED